MVKGVREWHYDSSFAWSRARRLREQVLVLFAFDTLNTALDIATVYVPLVNEFGEHRLLPRSQFRMLSEVHAVRGL